MYLFFRNANGILLYIPFCILLFSLNAILRHLAILVHVNLIFWVAAEYSTVWLDHTLSDVMSVGGCLGHPRFLTLTDNLVVGFLITYLTQCIW